MSDRHISRHHFGCTHHRREHHAHGRGAAGEFTLPGARRHYPPDLEIEPVHLDIDLRVDLGAREVRGTVTHTLRWNRAGASRLELHAIDLLELAVEGVDEGAGAPELSWTYDGERVRVCFAEGAPRGETRKLALRYRVREPVSGLFFASPEHYGDAWADAPRYAATDHETERARHWLPTVDLPSVRPTLAFHLRADAALTILANGVLESEEAHDDGTKTAHWVLDQPCPSYLTCFAIGEFVRLDDGDCEGVELAYFCTRAHGPAHLSRSFGGTAEIMRWMTARLGQPFPFPKYYQFALPHFGGAMENISLVSWDDGFILDEALAGEWGRLVDQINVHEMAHSWFGDRVVCRDYAHAWLKESWATYMEVCWFEDVLGRDEQLYELWLNAQSYFREADSRYRRPIVTRDYHSSFELYDMHLYPGGAARLHTLRGMLGDELFWEGVRTYLREYDQKVVETDDFRRVMEQVSGRSLGQFFDQWFRSPGYPELEVEFEYDDASERGTFTIKQAQVGKDAGKGGAEVPVFAFPLTLEWTVDGESERAQVDIERAQHGFSFDMGGEPDQVRVDPDFAVLHKLEFDPGTAKLETQLVEAPDVLGRILAGRVLAKRGKPAQIAKLRERWAQEPFWGVRLEWAKALGRRRSQACVEALVHAVTVEADLRVLEGLLRSCAEIRDEQLAAAVVERLRRRLPPRAAAAAWELLGNQREAAPFDELEAAASRDSYNGVAQSGALRALGATRDSRALGVLIARTKAGLTDNRARPAAVQALGELARRLDRGGRGRSKRSSASWTAPRPPLPRGACGGLGPGRGPCDGGHRRPRELRGQLTLQDAVRVRQILSGLRKAGEPRLTAAEKQIEGLREQLRKLEARVEALAAADDSE
ncbi:peptidase, M1 (aminopeptidase N) family protein [Plesiocystis pacifica SIR-1]|uniref:Aminopeptidase N n=1 Tax=Plesiocystis pacifica SIR-1 TaxID=391625 RepID=A6GGJ3_9BACT|nr:M1 family aminopeptidase [Plesiocystis pacifica]EDM75019.1 peptidase, M1 (aminopeptidase N) family protein [Plesiocystis pacifica SIR-1]